VVTPNPTGSTGYGQAFIDAIHGSWGGLSYIDLVKDLSYVHIDRAVALDACYMVNWIQGHPLGRKFKALVTHDGIFSMTSQLAGEAGGLGGESRDPWPKSLIIKYIVCSLLQ